MPGLPIRKGAVGVVFSEAVEGPGFSGDVSTTSQDGAELLRVVLEGEDSLVDGLCQALTNLVSPFCPFSCWATAWLTKA